MKLPIALIVAVPVCSCGVKAANSSTVTQTANITEVASDTSLSGEMVNQQISDALSGAFDQSSGDTSLTLTSDDQSVITRSCEAKDAKAVVSIVGKVDRAISRTSANGKSTSERTVTGESTMTRTWSRADGSAVSCNSAKTAAAANFDSPSGLQLDISFVRSRSSKAQLTTPRVTKNWSSEYTAEGTRTVVWSENSSSSDSSTSYFRNKSITSSVSRTAIIVGKDGSSKSINLDFKTKDSSPLVVKVERSKADNSVLSRTFVSGVVIATKADVAGRMEVSYSDLKVDATSTECKVASGSATATFYDQSGTVLKIYTLSVDADGEATLVDQDGESVSDFSLDGCDAEDLKL